MILISLILISPTVSRTYFSEYNTMEVSSEELLKDDSIINSYETVSESVNKVNDYGDVFSEREMLEVLNNIDLSKSDNTDAVADVLKTLSGPLQLEFLMNKFMIRSGEAENEHDDSKFRVKRSVDNRESFGSPSKHSFPIHGKLFKMQQYNNKFASNGPKGVLLARSAMKHGFADALREARERDYYKF